MTRTDPQELLADYPVVIDLPIQWGDMDAFGHVNNTMFFRYFESARIAYLVRIGFEGGSDRPGPILASTHCRFRRPLAFPDTVRVGARATEMAEDRFVMEYRIVSDALGEVAAEGGGVVVSFHYGEGRKTPLPDTVRQAIESLEGWTR